MTSLELHEHLTPEQHSRWMAMSDAAYDLAKKFVAIRVEDGQSIRQAIDGVDESYREGMRQFLDGWPF